MLVAQMWLGILRGHNIPADAPEIQLPITLAIRDQENHHWQ